MTDNKPNLDAEAAEKFKAYFGNIRRNTMDAASYAYSIHTNYISKDGKKYAPEFKKWWDTHNLAALFGTMSNWAKWHSAGEVIAKFESSQEFKKHFDKLPTSLTGLKAVYDLTEQELRLCVENTFTRTSLLQPEEEWARPKKPKPLINSSATAAAIDIWRKKWREPAQKVKKDPRSLTLLTVKVHGNFYNFDKETAEPTGFTSPEKLRQLVNDARKVFIKKENDEEHILVEAHAETLISNSEKRQLAASAAIVKRKAKAAVAKKKKKNGKEKKS